MNNRWAARMLGLIMLVVFLLLILNLQKQLLMMQRRRNPQTTTRVGAPAPGPAALPRAAAPTLATRSDDENVASRGAKVMSGR